MLPFFICCRPTQEGKPPVKVCRKEKTIAAWSVPDRQWGLLQRLHAVKCKSPSMRKSPEALISQDIQDLKASMTTTLQ